MGAPLGNCNACKYKHRTGIRNRSNVPKGWYKKSGTKRYLYESSSYNDRIKKLSKHWTYSYDKFGKRTDHYVP
jgi:hypothetical protein